MKSKWWLVALSACLLLAALSPLASTAPDGLERVAEGGGFPNSAGGSPFEIMAEYVFPGIQNEALATMLAGVVGVLLLFGMVYGLAWLLLAGKRKKPV